MVPLRLAWLETRPNLVLNQKCNTPQRTVSLSEYNDKVGFSVLIGDRVSHALYFERPCTHVGEGIGRFGIVNKLPRVLCGFFDLIGSLLDEPSEELRIGDELFLKKKIYVELSDCWAALRLSL